MPTSKHTAASRLRRLATAAVVGALALALPGTAAAETLTEVEVSAPNVTPADPQGYGVYSFEVSGVPATAPAEFKNGPKVGHCIQKLVGTGVDANSSLHSAPDWATPLSGLTAAQRSQIKWLLLSSRVNGSNAAHVAHQNAIWHITDGDALVKAGAQALYDAAVAGSTAAGQSASLTAGGSAVCAGQTRTLTVAGTAFGTGDLDITGSGQFVASTGVVVSADGKHADITLDGDGSITVTVLGTAAGSVTIAGAVDESVMVQAHRDLANPGSGAKDRQDFAYVEIVRTPVSATLNFLDCKPAVTKTVTPEFARTFGWTIAKSVDQARVVTTASTATFTYTVNLTKLPGVDSGWKANGAITVTNSTAVAMTLGSITDAVNNGGTCTVTAGASTPLAAGASVSVPYLCTYPASGPSASAGVNTATVTWTRDDCAPVVAPAVLPGYCTGTESFSADFAFAAPTQLVNNSVNVSDTFDGVVTVLDSNVTASKTYTYTKVVQVPAARTVEIHNNCSNFATTDTPTATGKSCISVAVERPAAPPVITSKPEVPAGPGKARLAISKTAAKASIGAGATGSYLIKVSNTSAVAATNVRLCDVLPDGLGFDSSSKKGSFTQGRVCWNLGTIGAGKSVSVTIKAKVAKTASGSVCNSANVTASNASSMKDRACMKITRPKQQVRGVVEVTG